MSLTFNDVNIIKKVIYTGTRTTTFRDGCKVCEMQFIVITQN